MSIEGNGVRGTNGHTRIGKMRSASLRKGEAAKDGASNKCVLAYSGGLDTTAIVVWLQERGYEVHAVLIDVGQEEDMQALCQKALRLGAKTAVIRDAKPAMCRDIIRTAIALGATYEGTYRLGTALARPFIALEQVCLAKELGGATLVHGATGKGNDQIRFEFAYRSLAPDCPVLAPWKVWDLGGRSDLINYLRERGIEDEFELTKEFSLDENLWHLSIEGGPLEDPTADVDTPAILAKFSHRFAGGQNDTASPPKVRVSFKDGVPVALNGKAMPLLGLVHQLNHQYRSAPWAWDLVIENRFTGVKSRGIYINPAAKLLQFAVDGLARTCLNKAAYDCYTSLGGQYGAMIYRGEFFSDQRLMIESAARPILSRLTGEVTVQLSPTPYVCKIEAPEAIFNKKVSTFERSDFSHQDAAGFIRLSWMSSVGRDFTENTDGGPVETGDKPAPRVRRGQSLPAPGLVPASV